jgi:hypothetical protein
MEITPKDQIGIKAPFPENVHNFQQKCPQALLAGL